MMKKIKRWASQNPIAIALNNVSKLTADEVKELTHKPCDAFARMRQGRGTDDDWSQLHSICLIALGIEHHGVVRGLSEHLQTADKVLDAIKSRAYKSNPDAWTPTSLTANEIESIELLIDLYEYQIRQLSFSEYRNALTYALAELRKRNAKLMEQ